MSSGNELLFQDDEIKPDLPQQPEPKQGQEYLVLVVDDDEYVHQLTKMVLRGFSFEGAPIKLASAMSAKEAKYYIATHDNVAVALIDVVMETDHAGLDLVNYIREEQNNNQVRLLIRTGQPGAAPEESVFHDYDINDYLSKTDITAHKLRMALLNALRSYRDIHRAADLQKQIMQAEQESIAAAAANEAKSQFLAHMSHEIRTPLNGILGLTDVLAQTQLNNTQQDFLKTIRHSGESLLSIINDILDFSKIEAGKLELENIDFSLGVLCDDLEGLFMPQVQEKSLGFHIDIDKSIPPYLKGDPLRIKQVLLNLISNSLKFTHKGSVSVAINLKQEKPLILEFIVTDTGIGISLEKQEQLFKPFTQVDSSTTRKYGGTGLGLQISQKLVQIMGGDIELKSEPNKGSEFHFELHLAKGKRTQENEDKSLAHAQKSASDIKILVAEDNNTNQLVITSMLKKLGYQYEICANGQEAIDNLGNDEYDLILMDCQMPVLDGFSATEKIRENPDWKNLPIIALTAGATEKEQQQCFDSGMNDFLSKPIKLSILQNALQRWH
ncbi:response regulator [Bermanella sp. R86510]|uniref:response regulator n=1 Tax=unclassified Bermanella TaxID=2627862 RepID=UPI0037C7C34A